MKASSLALLTVPVFGLTMQRCLFEPRAVVAPALANPGAVARTIAAAAAAPCIQQCCFSIRIAGATVARVRQRAKDCAVGGRAHDGRANGNADRRQAAGLEKLIKDGVTFESQSSRIVCHLFNVS